MQPTLRSKRGKPSNKYDKAYTNGLSRRRHPHEAPGRGRLVRSISLLFSP